MMDDDPVKNEIGHINRRIDDLDSRIAKTEANMTKAVMGVLGAALLLIWEPLKRVLTGGGQ